MKPRIKQINGQEVELRDGKLWENGVHRFLKIGKPLRNYSNAAEIKELIADLPRIADKQYSCLELNCYWHHFDHTGTGEIDVDLEPLSQLVDAIVENGMYPALSVETYGVGGGQIPSEFWEKHPDALAKNHLGINVRDVEYGFDTAVPSLFNKDYIDAVHRYISNLVSALGGERFLYFETTVEPQFMGAEWLDYSDNARAAYEVWLEEHNLPGPAFPDSFPVSDDFLHDPTWNLFRAQSLANWVSADARAFRAAAGAGAWIAADYLDADENTMTQRCGIPIEFLKQLSEIDIIQVNWSWNLTDNKPNLKAYQRVRQAMEENSRDWAITEHMTLNGCDYVDFDVEKVLENTIQQGTGFAWEFVDIATDLDDESIPPNHIKPGAFIPCHFGLYDENWNPRPPMAIVEDRWDDWMAQIAKQTATEPAGEEK
jgi:hypothetical protein